MRASLGKLSVDDNGAKNSSLHLGGGAGYSNGSFTADGSLLNGEPDRDNPAPDKIHEARISPGNKF